MPFPCQSKLSIRFRYNCPNLCHKARHRHGVSRFSSQTSQNASPCVTQPSGSLHHKDDQSVSLVHHVTGGTAFCRLNLPVLRTSPRSPALLPLRLLVHSLQLLLRVPSNPFRYPLPRILVPQGDKQQNTACRDPIQTTKTSFSESRVALGR